MSNCLQRSQRSGLGAENARKAYALREKVSERERFGIEATYYAVATGELEKAAQTDGLWQQTYPRDGEGLHVDGIRFRRPGKLGKALEEFRAALRWIQIVRPL